MSRCLITCADTIAPNRHRAGRRGVLRRHVCGQRGEAFPFRVATGNQAETDRLWKAIADPERVAA